MRSIPIASGRSPTRKRQREISGVASNIENRNVVDRFKGVRYLIDHTVVEAPHGVVCGEKLVDADFLRELARKKDRIGIIETGIRAKDG